MARTSSDRVVRVKSAVPLTETEKEAFRTKLAQKYGEGLVLRFEVDEALIGGVVVRVGDQVIDASIASKLAALKQELLG